MNMKSLLLVYYLFVYNIIAQIDGIPVIVNTGFIQTVMCQKNHRSHAEFSYSRDSKDGPQCWPRIDIQCAGKYQSPINIETQYAKLIYTTSQNTCTKWTEKPQKIDVENTGYYVKLTFTYSDGETPTLSPTPISFSKYKLVQGHFHFIGSEHTFDKITKFSMEGHIVFYNYRYNSFEEATNYKDGLLVITKFYKLSETAHFDFPFLSKVKHPDDLYIVTKESSFSLKDVFGNINFNFYSYSGSLTTPGCNEVVSFMLDDKPLTINSRILSDLGNIKGSEGQMSPNIRPTQAVNNRELIFYHTTQ